jgi:pentatricopeptide repeat protein
MAANTLKESNNLISLLGRRKKLNEANKVFMKIKDIANQYSWSTILNAHVDCGDIAGAQAIFNEILNNKSKEKKKGDSKIRPDVITCTTMIKGYISIFDLNSALVLLNNMSKFQPKVVPNIRTFNTLFRGCVFTGNVDTAIELFSKAKELNIDLDSSSYEMYVSLLCESLRLEVVFPMIGRVKDQMKSSIAIFYYHLGQALFVKGDFKKMNKVLMQASEHINSIIDSENDNSNTAVAVAVGGKRSWNNVMDENRQESLLVYLNHKAKELERDIINLKSFKYHDLHRQVSFFQHHNSLTSMFFFL